MRENQKYFKKFFKNIFRKWIAGIVLFILLSVGGLAAYLNKQLKPMLTERIKETIKNSSESLYTIDFEDVTINLITGNVSFKNIVFKPDSIVYQALKRKGTAPRHLYKVEISSLIFNRVNPRKVYLNRELNMDALIINDPLIQVYFEDLKEKDEEEVPSKTIYQYVSKYLKSVHIGDIVLAYADFKYIDRAPVIPDTIEVKDVNIKINDLLIDSSAQFDKKRFYYTNDVFVQVKNHTQQTKDGMYEVRLDEFSASTANQYLNLRGLKVVPLYPDITFSRKFKVQTDRYNMAFEEILLNSIDFKNLNVKRRLSANSLLIRGAAINVFLNRELPKANIDKGRNFPHVALKRLKLNTLIDTVRIENTTINYTEYNPKTASRGTLFFRGVNGTLLNLTNDSTALAKNNWARSNFSAMLMGKALLTLSINLNLTDPNARFNYSGSLGALNARDINPVLRPLGMVEIKSGNISKAIFSINGNNKTSSGKIQLYYTNLKVGVLAKEDDKVRLKKKGLLSLIANALLIRDNNPSLGEPLRVGYTSFVRTPDGSFFNMLWKSLFEGIKISIGLTAAKEKELIENFNTLKGSKPDRIERREERKEKRDVRKENQ